MDIRVARRTRGMKMRIEEQAALFKRALEGVF
jgi:hypothetical protein